MLMFRTLLFLWVACLGLSGSVPATMAKEDGLQVKIQVSPDTIVLFANRAGNWVTVHVAIRYEDVDTRSLTLNGVPATLVESDDCGFLVAKVRMTALSPVLVPGFNTMLFEGMDVYGGSFWGVDRVLVKAREWR